MPKYTIEIKGNGGEYIAGEVKPEFLEALEENSISINDYAEGDPDDERFECIPEEIRPFDPGGWFNINPYIVWRNLCDIDRMELHIYGEDFETIYYAVDQHGDNLHQHDNWTLDEQGEVSFSIYDPGSKWEGKCVYSCQRDEYGVFFSGEFELDEPFDPKKLCLMTVNLNELDMISKVVYYLQLDVDGNPVGEGIEIQDEGDHETDINGATHELMLL